MFTLNNQPVRNPKSSLLFRPRFSRWLPSWLSGLSWTLSRVPLTTSQVFFGGGGALQCWDPSKSCFFPNPTTPREKGRDSRGGSLGRKNSDSGALRSEAGWGGRRWLRRELRKAQGYSSRRTGAAEKTRVSVPCLREKTGENPTLAPRWGKRALLSAGAGACAAVAGHPPAKGQLRQGVGAAGTPEGHSLPGSGCRGTWRCWCESLWVKE